MANYENSTREIMVGDRVVGIGQCDSRSINGALGTVRSIRNSSYVAGVEFDCDIGGHSLGGLCEDGHGLYVHEGNIAFVGRGCEVVAPEHRCTVCGGAVNADSILGSRLFKNERMCDKCIARTIGTVHEYHFGKSLKYNVCADKLTFGAEIEIDAPDDEDFDSDARETLAQGYVEYCIAHNYPILMHFETDGSLSDGGVECITAPLTLNDIRSDIFKNQIIWLFNTASALGFYFGEDNHAGLHVHIGRRSLCGDDTTISEAVGLLMGWAVTRLWDAGMEDVSRRCDIDYCKLYSDGWCRGSAGLSDTGAISDRYRVVNIQNKRTIELRVFGAAQSYEDVVQAIDMAYMLAKWSNAKINAFLKRGTYSARAHRFDDALEYADRLTWGALVKYSKFPEITIPRLKYAGVNI